MPTGCHNKPLVRCEYQIYKMNNNVKQLQGILPADMKSLRTTVVDIQPRDLMVSISTDEGMPIPTKAINGNADRNPFCNLE